AYALARALRPGELAQRVGVVGAVAMRHALELAAAGGGEGGGARAIAAARDEDAREEQLRLGEIEMIVVALAQRQRALERRARFGGPIEPRQIEPEPDERSAQKRIVGAAV